MKNKIFNHLNNDYTEAVRDPIWKNIYLSKSLLDLINLETVQKLNRIKQLGPAYLVYPGATHTRLSHSLGVFHIAKRLIEKLLTVESDLNFTLEGIKAFLTAALLHDLGHYPFAHSLKDLNLRSHESLTAALIEEALNKQINGFLGIEPEWVAAIIDPSRTCTGFENLDFYRNLLSGVLDPDKLDYLNRDAYFCGVPYGIQDVDFILNEVLPYGKNEIAISEKGLTSVESVLFSKYLMYKTVYWHKTVRVATAMVKKAIILALREGVIEKKDLYWLDDESFFEKFSLLKFDSFKLISLVQKRKLYKAVGFTNFSYENSKHIGIENLEERLKYESYIASEISSLIGEEVREDEIIIDVPERISFEADLWIAREEDNSFVKFGESSSVFDIKLVRNFKQSLRRITLITSRNSKIIEAVEKIGIENILK